MVYYSYMKPPSYDDLLTRKTIEFLVYAPIFFLLVGAIAFSNQQVFMNYVPKLDPEEVYPLSNHTFKQFWYQLTPGTPLFIFMIMNILIAMS